MHTTPRADSPTTREETIGQKTGQIHSVQLLRGIAAWLVVFHHFEYRVGSPVGAFFTKYGNFGVDIFFLISGFIMHRVMSSRDEGEKAFVVRRLLRIVPAYWVATILALLAKTAFPRGFEYTDWTPQSLLLSLSFVPHQNPSGSGVFPLLVVGWSLNIEVFYYLLLAGCSMVARKQRFIACSLILIALPLIWRPSWPLASVLGTRLLHEFVAGMAIGFLYLRVPRVWSLARRSPAIACALAAAVVILLHVDGIVPRAAAAALILVIALLWEPGIQASRAAIVRLGLYLGAVSYSTYLLHNLVHGVQLHLVGRPTSPSAEAVGMLVATVAVLVSAHLGFRFVERSGGLAPPGPSSSLTPGRRHARLL